MTRLRTAPLALVALTGLTGLTGCADGPEEPSSVDPSTSADGATSSGAGDPAGAGGGDTTTTGGGGPGGGLPASACVFRDAPVVYETPVDVPERLALSAVEGGFSPLFGGIDSGRGDPDGNPARELYLPEQQPLAWDAPAWEPAQLHPNGYVRFWPTHFPFATWDGVVAAIWNLGDSTMLRLLGARPPVWFNQSIGDPLTVVEVGFLDHRTLVIAHQEGGPAAHVGGAGTLAFSVVQLERPSGNDVEGVAPLGLRTCADRPVVVAFERLATRTVLASSNGSAGADCDEPTARLPPTAVRVSLLGTDADLLAQGGIAFDSVVTDVRLAARGDGAWLGVMREGGEGMEVLAVGDDATVTHVTTVDLDGGELALSPWKDGFAIVETAPGGARLRLRLFDGEGALVDDSAIAAGETPYIGPPAFVASPDGRSIAVGSFVGGTDPLSSPLVIRRADCAL